MRYAANHKERTHARIVEAASRLFKQGGYGGVGVDSVMKAAGLTPGGFYAHFRSKDVLLAETLPLALRRMRNWLFRGLEGERGLSWLRVVVRRYLSRTHRDAVAEGCPMPALTPEVARAGALARETFEAHLRDLVAEFEARMPRTLGPPRDRSLATIALFVGGVMLARAVKDRKLSGRILRACRLLAIPEEAPHAPPS
ncbi:MAG: TetR/AcrR family transcriptional regulator [Candidatus Rokubacteria bacterium]|nr:TetR/AcrR family transcriptional regulator [Candidatus Rokubacteria bacterium]